MKNVVVTGSSRGIGLAIAKRFLAGGWKVWALQRAEKGLDELKPLGAVQFVPFDAADPASVLAAAKRVAQEAGSVSALINNAGVAQSSPLARTSTEDFLRIQQINVTAPFVLTRELLPLLLESKGRVVNIASTAAKKGFKYTSAYCTSKHALLGMTRSLAVELASKGVTLNAVCPGWTDTDMLAASTERISKATGKSATEAKEVLLQMNPMGRAVKPEEVAELTYWLSDAAAAAAITGADYVIDGGEIV